MTEAEIIQKIIRPCLEKSSIDAISDSTIIYGETGAVLDSLNLVSFIFLIEEETLKAAGAQIKFGAEDILNTERKPFLNIKNLAGFIKEKLSSVENS